MPDKPASLSGISEGGLAPELLAENAESRNAILKEPAEKKDLLGLTATIAAFTLWGILPIYWKSLEQVPALEILSHRIFWSAILLGVILLAGNKTGFIKHLKSRRVRWSLVIAGLLLGLNWFTYIFAVNSDHIVQASLGYYINPLFTIFFGMILFKEKLNKIQTAALVLAATGVIIITVEYGEIPWIALTLAITFALYSAAKKASPLDSLSGLFMETLILAPLAGIYVIFLAADGGGALINAGPGITLLLILSGAATSLPLFLFGFGARRIPLVSVGFIHYLGPSLMLFIGVLLYAEPFTLIHGISFGFIWVALVFYSISIIRNMYRKNKIQSSVK